MGAYVFGIDADWIFNILWWPTIWMKFSFFLCKFTRSACEETVGKFFSNRSNLKACKELGRFESVVDSFSEAKYIIWCSWCCFWWFFAKVSCLLRFLRPIPRSAFIGIIHALVELWKTVTKYRRFLKNSKCFRWSFGAKISQTLFSLSFLWDFKMWNILKNLASTTSKLWRKS